MGDNRLGLGMQQFQQAQQAPYQQSVYEAMMGANDSIYAKAAMPRDPVQQATGQARSLLNSISDVGQGPAQAAQFAQIQSSAKERAKQLMLGMDRGHIQTLDALNDFTNAFDKVGRHDVDALAESANLMQDTLAFDKVLAGDPTLNARMAQQQKLNARGIQEYGSPTDGNYMKLDSWAAIAADAAKQRNAHIAQAGYGMVQNLQNRAGNYQAVQQRTDADIMSKILEAQAHAGQYSAAAAVSRDQLAAPDKMSARGKAELAKTTAETDLLGARSQNQNRMSEGLKSLQAQREQLGKEFIANKEAMTDPEKKAAAAQLQWMDKQINSLAGRLFAGEAPQQSGTPAAGAKHSVDPGLLELIKGTPGDRKANIESASRQTNIPVAELVAALGEEPQSEPQAAVAKTSPAAPSSKAKPATKKSAPPTIQNLGGSEPVGTIEGMRAPQQPQAIPAWLMAALAQQPAVSQYPAPQGVIDFGGADPAYNPNGRPRVRDPRIEALLRQYGR